MLKFEGWQNYRPDRYSKENRFDIQIHQWKVTGFSLDAINILGLWRKFFEKKRSFNFFFTGTFSERTVLMSVADNYRKKIIANVIEQIARNYNSFVFVTRKGIIISLSSAVLRRTYLIRNSSGILYRSQIIWHIIFPQSHIILSVILLL